MLLTAELLRLKEFIENGQQGEALEYINKKIEGLKNDHVHDIKKSIWFIAMTREMNIVAKRLKTKDMKHVMDNFTLADLYKAAEAEEQLLKYLFNEHSDIKPKRS